MGPLARTDACCGATRVGTDHFHERIYRAVEETVGCRRRGNHRGCPESTCIKALAEGERRLEKLQLQEKSVVTPVPDAEAEFVQFRAQVAELQGSANVLQRHTKQRICLVEDMPG